MAQPNVSGEDGKLEVSLVSLESRVEATSKINVHQPAIINRSTELTPKSFD